MNVATGLDALLEPLSQCLDAESARRLLALRIDPSLQQRVDTLATKANNGSLTIDERAEYVALVNGADFISILKLKAKRQLDQNPK